MRKLVSLSALTFSATLLAGAVQAADYNLRFAHFWPATSGMHKAFEAWGQALEDASDGRIEMEFYPSQTLAKAGAAFDALDRQGREEAVAAAHEIITLEGGVENPDWKPVLEAATEKYLGDLEERGLPARNIYARATALNQSCSS